MNVVADSYVTSYVADIPSARSSLSVSSFSPPASPVTFDVTVPSHPVEDGEEVVNGHVVGSELHEHEQPPHPTPKVFLPEDERPLVVVPSLRLPETMNVDESSESRVPTENFLAIVADSYLSPCAEPISSLVADSYLSPCAEPISSLVADSYLSPCAEPISSLVADPYVSPGSSASSLSLASRFEAKLLLFNNLLSNYIKRTPVELLQSKDHLSLLELAAEFNTPLHSGNASSSDKEIPFIPSDLTIPVACWEGGKKESLLETPPVLSSSSSPHTASNHTTENLLALGIEPSSMSDDGVRMSVVPSHPASLVTCDLMGPLVVGPSLQFALVATGELETLPSSASSPPNTPLNNNNNNNNELTNTNEFSSNLPLWWFLLAFRTELVVFDLSLITSKVIR